MQLDVGQLECWVMAEVFAGAILIVHIDGTFQMSLLCLRKWIWKNQKQRKPGKHNEN